jgi:hypothetical protein
VQLVIVDTLWQEDLVDVLVVQIVPQVRLDVVLTASFGLELHWD